MRVVRSVRTDRTLLPQVSALLSALPDRILFHERHGAYHPFATYSRSLSRLVATFSPLLGEMKALVGSPEKKGGDVPDYDLARLCGPLLDLLEAANSHIEDCLHVLKAIHPPLADSGPLFVDRWLDKAKHPSAATFKARAESHKRRLSLVPNKVKHGHRSLRGCVVWSGRVRIPGYYLEAPSGDAVVLDPEVHPHGGLSSLPLTMHYQFAHVYLVSEWLADAVKDACRKLHGLKLRPSAEGASRDEKMNGLLAELVRDIVALPWRCYPSEQELTLGRTYYTVVDGHGLLTIEYPTHDRPTPLAGSLRVSTQFAGDGVTRRFQLPAP